MLIKTKSEQISVLALCLILMKCEVRQELSRLGHVPPTVFETVCSVEWSGRWIKRCTVQYYTQTFTKPDKEPENFVFGSPWNGDWEMSGFTDKAAGTLFTPHEIPVVFFLIIYYIQFDIINIPYLYNSQLSRPFLFINSLPFQ